MGDRGQKIFNSFLILVASTVLFLLPLTQSAEEFKIDRHEDTFSLVTSAGQSTDNVVLSEELYEDDTTSINIISDLSTDTISWGSYNATDNHLLISGMTAGGTRVLTATYEVDALDGNTAVIQLANYLPIFWLLLCIAFAPTALAAIFTGRD